MRGAIVPMVGSHDNQDDGDFNALEPFFLQPYYFESLSTVHTPVNFQKASKRIIFFDGVAYFVHSLFFLDGAVCSVQAYNTIWSKSFKNQCTILPKNNA